MSGVYTYEDRIDLVAATYDFADSTTPVVFQPGRPINVRRIVGVITEASAGSSVVTVAVRNVDDTSSTTIGTFTVPASLALNTVFKVDVAAAYSALQTGDGGGISQPATVTMGRVVGRQTSLPGEVKVNPGQEISFTSDVGGSAGMANLYIEYSEMGNNPDRFNATAITFTLA